MKKALAGIFFAAGLTGAIIIGTADKATVKALQVGDYRIAVADRACPVEGEPGYNYLISVCAKHKTVHNYCACATKEEDPLTGEMDPAEIPDAAFRRVGVCEWTDDEGNTVRGLKWLPVGEAPDPSLTCVLIANRILNWRISYRAAKTQLLLALQAKCCSLCEEGECFVSPGEWGRCPRCLLDSTAPCSDHCGGSP